jgi:hypothetical protein
MRASILGMRVERGGDCMSRLYTENPKTQNIYPIFSIIVSSLSMFSVSSLMSDSVLADARSLCSLVPPTWTRTRESSSCDAMSSVLLLPKKFRSDCSGHTISDLSELIYLGESNRLPLFARVSTRSSRITRDTISPKVEANPSNPSLRVL